MEKRSGLSMGRASDMPLCSEWLETLRTAKYSGRPGASSTAPLYPVAHGTHHTVGVNLPCPLTSSTQ